MNQVRSHDPLHRAQCAHTHLYPPPDLESHSDFSVVLSIIFIDGEIIVFKAMERPED